MALSRGAFLALAIPCLSPLWAQDKAPDSPWTSLCDGTLDGWVRRSGTATFTVEDRDILATTAEGSGPTFLCTTREFANFELEFEVKLDPGINSGVMLRSKLTPLDENGKELGFGGRVYGPLVRIESSPGRSGWVYGEGTGLGWLSPEPNAKEAAVNQHQLVKNGDWNHFRVIAQGARIQTFLNGVRVADCCHPEIFQHHTAGFIALELPGISPGTGPFQARWRHLKIRGLP